MPVRKLLLAALGLAVVLHQDVWNWERLAWVGPLPAGLAYHLGFCFVIALLFAALVAIDRRSTRR